MKSFRVWLNGHIFFVVVVLLFCISVATFTDMRAILLFVSESTINQSNTNSTHQAPGDCEQGRCEEQSYPQSVSHSSRNAPPPFLQALQQNRSLDSVNGTRGGQKSIPDNQSSMRGMVQPLGNLPQRNEILDSAESSPPSLNSLSIQPPQQPQYKFRPFDEGNIPQPEAQHSKADLLTMARKAYWKGNHDLAVEHYGELIRLYPEEPDFAGELGNIYYEQGKQNLAAQAYYKAGQLLLQRREYDRVRRLLDILLPIDKELADELAKYIPRS